MAQRRELNLFYAGLLWSGERSLCRFATPADFPLQIVARIEGFTCAAICVGVPSFKGPFLFPVAPCQTLVRFAGLAGESTRAARHPSGRVWGTPRCREAAPLTYDSPGDWFSFVVGRALRSSSCGRGCWPRTTARWTPTKRISSSFPRWRGRRWGASQVLRAAGTRATTGRCLLPPTKTVGKDHESIRVPIRR